MTAVIRISDQTMPVHLIASAKTYLEASTAPATRKAYQSDWRIFAAWCRANAQTDLPATPETVALFLTSQAQTGTAPATLVRRLAAIRYAHEAANAETATTSKLVAATLKGIKRASSQPKQPKAPATADRLAAMIAAIPADTLSGKRDRAILALGFAGAFRRSELAALTVADLEATAEGLRVTIRQSKTDQEKLGQIIAIPNGLKIQPVKALGDWLDAAGIEAGPLFRPISKGGQVKASALSDKSISNLVKACAERAGFDPEQFAGHSLRAGFLTSAAEHGATVFKMAEVSRHKSLETLRVYVRSAELFKDHSGSRFL